MSQSCVCGFRLKYQRSRHYSAAMGARLNTNPRMHDISGGMCVACVFLCRVGMCVYSDAMMLPGRCADAQAVYVSLCMYAMFSYVGRVSLYEFCWYVGEFYDFIYIVI